MPGINRFSRKTRQERDKRTRQRRLVSAVKIGSPITIGKNGISRKNRFTNTVLHRKKAGRAARMSRRIQNGKTNFADRYHVPVVKDMCRAAAYDGTAQKQKRTVLVPVREKLRIRRRNKKLRSGHGGKFVRRADMIKMSVRQKDFFDRQAVFFRLRQDMAAVRRRIDDRRFPRRLVSDKIDVRRNQSRDKTYPLHSRTSFWILTHDRPVNFCIIS